MSASSFEESQEPSQSEYMNEMTHLSLVTLPKEMDPDGHFGVQHPHPNFFLLASSSRTQAPSAEECEIIPRGNGHDGEEEKEMQVLVTALDILARSGTSLKTNEEATGPVRLGSAGEDNRKQDSPGGVSRTSTGILLQTGIKTPEAPLPNTRIPGWLRMIIITLGLAATTASHAINMFNYPRYQEDEGTYMMYAWAVTHGKIDPYAYGYGHPPLAWILIAAWVKLTGGFFTFGDALNSGRVLMLLFTVGSAWLIYRITYHLRIKFIACLFAMLVFALSPLSITFQREVLLDNVATFWFLLALYLIVIGKSRLSYTISASICFGIALLSKEVLIIFFPVMVYVVWLYTARFQRTFLLVAFCYSVVAVGSTFVLMALLKGELFPYEWHLPWDHHPHLSLIGVYLTQVARGQSEGSVHDSWAAWTDGDPLLMTLGVATPVFNLIVGWWNRKNLFIALLAILFWVLLLRGGVVFPFYIIPLIPIISLNAAFAVNIVLEYFDRIICIKCISSALILAALMTLIPYDVQHSLSPYNVFSLDPTHVQNETVAWIRTHVPHQAMLVIDSQLFTDLHEPRSEGIGDRAAYPYAHVYWFVGLDPALHDTLLKGDWNNIDYIVADSGMIQKIQSYGGGMNLIKTALAHSVVRVTFGDGYEFIRVYQVIHVKY
jgi:hypothetical protein